jgi:hypothetical protein
MKRVMLALLKLLTAVCGARVVDQRTGQVIGKAIFIPWRGRLRIIGLEDKRVIPAFERQERLTYWQQSLSFSTHPEPDFPNERNDRKAHDHTDPPA